MGQAKQRGAREDRVAEALNLKKVDPAEARRLLGLDDSAIFMGYVVHVEKSDEFLADYKETSITVERKFAKTPDLAKCFDDFIGAYDIARAGKGEVVAMLFDVGSQYKLFVMRSN